MLQYNYLCLNLNWTFWKATAYTHLYGSPEYGHNYTVILLIIHTTCISYKFLSLYKVLKEALIILQILQQDFLLLCY